MLLQRVLFSRLFSAVVIGTPETVAIVAAVAAGGAQREIAFAVLDAALL
jgi:hypothetical protein